MSIQPKDQAEAVAVFRAMVIGPVVQRTFTHGELATKLRELSEERVRPPEAESTRTYSVSWCRSRRCGGCTRRTGCRAGRPAKAAATRCDVAGRPSSPAPSGMAMSAM